VQEEAKVPARYYYIEKGEWLRTKEQNLCDDDEDDDLEATTE
jgi:hypothetical protein